ncbi:hypothetical protein [Anaerosinus massiliensis]|uniref:hypothetical protein n=1 Tax=Massilibacillus massiliensis TaxID=1806837 RepID=UPI000DA61FC7|nr:hypothetical protein [Massilibacillus massiliensis]
MAKNKYWETVNTIFYSPVIKETIATASQKIIAEFKEIYHYFARVRQMDASPGTDLVDAVSWQLKIESDTGNWYIRDGENEKWILIGTFKDGVFSILDVINKIINGDIGIGKTKGALTIQQNGTSEQPFNGSVNQTINITPLKIKVFNSDNKLLFPNGSMMWIESEPVKDTSEADISKAYSTGYDTGYGAGTSNGYSSGYKEGYESGNSDTTEANKVIKLINDIGTVAYSPESLALIVVAEEAYAKLTEQQKELVSNNDVLTTARKTYDELGKDAGAGI